MSRYILNVRAYELSNGTDPAIQPCRIVAWPDGMIRVYAAEGKDIRMVLEGQGTYERIDMRPATYRLVVDGQEWTAKYVSCGCASPVKKWPYEGLPA